MSDNEKGLKRELLDTMIDFIERMQDINITLLKDLASTEYADCQREVIMSVVNDNEKQMSELKNNFERILIELK